MNFPADSMMVLYGKLMLVCCLVIVQTNRYFVNSFPHNHQLQQQKVRHSDHLHASSQPWSCIEADKFDDVNDGICFMEPISPQSPPSSSSLPQIIDIHVEFEGDIAEFPDHISHEQHKRLQRQRKSRIINNDNSLSRPYYRLQTHQDALRAPIISESGSSGQTLITVNNYYDDYLANSSYCFLTSSYCNLRSAWLGCMIISSRCQILLPENKEIYINKTYEALVLKSSANVELIGRNTSIASVGVALNDGLVVINNGSFPYRTGNLSDTNSDQQNYATTCLNACPGQQINISTCDPRTVGDTYIRLYQGTVQVATNDDTCGLKSQIVYNVPLSVVNCQQYCVRLGCYGSSNCSIYAFATIAPSSSPQLITFTQIPGAATPSLLVHNVSIQKFGTSTYSGGAFYFSGTVYFTLSHSSIIQNTASLGSAFYITGNTALIHVHHCLFYQNPAAIYIDGNSSNTIIENSSVYGGISFIGTEMHENIVIRDSIIYYDAIYIGDAIANNVTLANLEVISPEYSFLYLVQRGSDVTVMNINIHPDFDYLNNDDDNGDSSSWLTEEESQFTPVISTIYIGPDCIDIEIMNVSVFCNNIQPDFVSSYIANANLITIKSSSFINITDFSVLKCQATQSVVGGMIGVVNSEQITMDDIRMDTVVSKLMGGAIFLQYSKNITIKNSHFESCRSTDSGGAIALYSENEKIQIVNSVISKCEAPHYGGGIYLGTNNDYVTVAGVNLTDNIAKDSGGGIFLSQTNYQFAVLDLQAYENFVTLETAHPYVVPHTYQGFTTDYDTIIYQQFVEVPGATEYILNFDSATQFQTELYVAIYAYPSGSYLYRAASSDQLPGVTAPSLRLVASAFIFTFYVPNPKTPITSGLYGIKAYIYPSFPAAITQPSIFSGNSARKGGGILFYYANQFSVLLNVLLTNNSALTGGGIIYQNGNVGGALQQVILSDNRANLDGGGLVIQSGQFGMTLRYCQFLSNIAGLDGGGIYFGSSNGVGILAYGNVIRFTSPIFFNNSALSGGGGAVYASSDASAAFITSKFDGNHAFQGDGGAVYLGQACNVNFSGTSWFTNNKAANRGGFLMSSQGNVITLIKTNYFISNYAGFVGGAIVLFNSSVLVTQLGSVFFQWNEAKFGGGAITFASSPLWVPLTNSHFMFANNSSPRGSALFIYDLINTAGSLTFPNKVVNTSFIHNFATVGGTVYWVYDATSMNSEPNVRDRSNYWADNVAGYGNMTATQAISIYSPPQYEVTVYGTYLTPDINITLYDFYNQLVTVSGDTAIAVSIIDSNCTSYAFLSGPDLYDNGVSMINSTGRFNQLQATCSPNGWAIIQFTAQIGILAETSNIGSASAGNVLQSYYIRNNTILKFRGCAAGEFETKGECQVCQLSTYNLVPNSPKCESCTGMDGVESCQGNQLVLKQGYWRRYETSSAVLPCLLDPISCTGGTTVGTASCSIGYDGPLCAVCSSGYFGSNNKCIECTESTQITPAMIALLTILFVALIFAFLLYRALSGRGEKDKANQNQADSDDEESEEEPGNSRPLPTAGADGDQPPSTIALIYWWMREKYDDIIVRLKIVVSTFQVISSSASVFSISFPVSFSNFTNGLKFFNIGIGNLIPIGCTGEYNFVDTVLWTSLGPIVVSFVLLLCFLFEYALVRYKIQKKRFREKGMKKKAFHETKSKYLNYFFYLTYLVLPSVTTTLFQWFICTNVDPNNEDSDHYDRFLTADMSISCQSDYYKQWTIYVVLMILLYPVGIPALYLYLLYGHKDEIMNRDNEDEKPEKEDDRTSTTSKAQRSASIGSSISSYIENGSISADAIAREIDEELAIRKKNLPFGEQQEEGEKKPTTLSVTTQRLAFLWQAYEPRYWYWEVIETTRKLVLTAVLSVCSPGSSEQSVLGVLMSYAYIRLYSYYRPYDEKAEDILAETGQVQILMTFFVTLVLQNGLLTSKWDYSLGLMLTLINLSIVVLTFYYEVDNYRAAVKEAQEKEAAWREERKLKLAQRRVDFAYKAGAVVTADLSQSNDSDNGTSGGIIPIKFKKMNAKDLQELDERKLKEIYGKGVVDSDDEDDSTINVLHAVDKIDRSNPKFVGAIELQSMSPTAPSKKTRNVCSQLDSDDES